MCQYNFGHYSLQFTGCAASKLLLFVESFASDTGIIDTSPSTTYKDSQEQFLFCLRSLLSKDAKSKFAEIELYIKIEFIEGIHRL